MKLLALLTVSLLCAVSSGLYADRAGEVDWYRQYVGHVTWMRFEQVPGSRRKVLVANRDTLAALSASSGAVVWRHVLPRMQAVLHNKNTLITVSQSNTVVLHSWEADSGLLRWTAPTELHNIEQEVVPPLNIKWRPGAVSAVLAGARQDLVLVAVDRRLGAFFARSGKPAWTVELPEGSRVVSLSCHESIARLLYLSQDQLLLTKYNTTAKGAVIDTHTIMDLKDVNVTNLQCIPTCPNNVICSISEKLMVYSMETRQIRKLELEEAIISKALLMVYSAHSLESLVTSREISRYISAARFQYLREWKGLSLPPLSVIQPAGTEGQFMLGHSLVKRDKDSNTFSLVCNDCSEGEGKGERQLSARVVVKRKDDKLMLRYWDDMHESGSDEVEIHLPTSVLGHVERVAVYPFYRSDGGRGLRCLIVLSDCTLVMVSQNGQIVWIREEAMRSAVAVEMYDPPAAGDAESAETIYSLLHSRGNPLLLATMRVRVQLTAVSHFLHSLLEKGVSSLVHDSSYEEMLRDQFNTRKIIMVATSIGKLFGLDSKGGNIVWRTYIPNLRPFTNGKLLLYTLRSSSQPPYSPVVAVLGTSSGICDNTVVVYINQLTGQLEGELTCLPYRITQAALLSLTDSTHLRMLLALDEDNIPHNISPPSALLAQPNTSNVILFTADIQSGVVRGFEVVEGVLLTSGHEGLQGVEVWRTMFPVQREKILSVASKNNEVVGSLGRPKADRSVQYKYLNPHLIAVITQSLDQAKPSLSVYLIDGVSGSIVYHIVHKHSTGPVGVVLSENWVVYYYFNVVSRRNEIAVLEMFDARNYTESEWSSSSPAVLPLVTGQSYTVPTSIRSLSTTNTLRSITPKSLLLGLHSGHIAMLRKDLLDPRRNITSTPDMVEDGLPEYMPVIPLPPQLYINYNQTVQDIEGIYSGSTGLESTSLVFAYGRDVFFTQVTPSKQYDLLAESFDKWLIAAVCGGLVFGTLVLSQLASRKMLKLLWK